MDILLVEDHQDSREVVVYYLTSLGHHVKGVQSVHDALDALSASSWDLLISDIGLPDGTGWNLLKQVRQRRPGYAVAMSGFGSNEDMALSREAGYREHLVKPIDLAVLDQVLQRAGAEIARIAVEKGTRH